VLSDSCPVIDPVIHSIKTDDDFGNALRGCLTGNQTLFQSLNIQKNLNMSVLREYQNEFINVTNFVNTYNFTEIDDYLDEVNGLYVYNLTAVAENTTVADLGWDPNRVYTGLNNLNQETEPYGHSYSLQNYTQLNLTDFPEDSREKINNTKTALDGLVHTNATIYEELAETQLQLEQTQHSIDKLVANMKQYTTQYYALKTDILAFSAQNASKAINITQDIQNLVDNLMHLGDCSFVGTRYLDMLDTLCDTVEPAVLWLTTSIVIMGTCVIALIIVVEVLAVRIPHPDVSVDGYYTLPDTDDKFYIPPPYNPSDELKPRRNNDGYQRQRDQW